MLGYSTLASWYEVIFSLHRYHNFDMKYVEDLLPYERDIYVGLSIQASEKEAEEAEEY